MPAESPSTEQICTETSRLVPLIYCRDDLLQRQIANTAHTKSLLGTLMRENVDVPDMTFNNRGPYS